MDSQISLFQAEKEEQIKTQLTEALNEVLTSNGLDGLVVKWDKLKSPKTKSVYSCKFQNAVLFRITTYISDPSVQIELSGQDASEPARKAKTKKLVFSDSNSALQCIPEITKTLRAILDSAPKEISCCSRYEQCSDNKKCIHPDKNIALGCNYRKILHSGRIFYGKNRNVD